MAKKITITLDGVAEQMFYEVMYALDNGTGKCTQSEAIDACLCECWLFEQITDDQITNYLNDKYPGRIKKELKKFEAKSKETK